MSPSAREGTPNNGMQRTALRAAADAERSPNLRQVLMERLPEP